MNGPPLPGEGPPGRRRPDTDWERSVDPGTRQALERFGAEVAKLCADRGWSQHGLARRSHVSQASISRMTRGLAPGMRLDTVARILEALDGHVTGEPWSTVRRARE